MALRRGPQAIRCAGLYRRASDRYDPEPLCIATTLPAYFDAIDRERVVAAGDARTDPRTREFRDGYLIPTASARCSTCRSAQDNAAVGVLCAEHVGGARPWTVDEQNFAISVGQPHRRRAWPTSSGGTH